MLFVVIVLGFFLGRLFIGGLLNFFINGDYIDENTTENGLSLVGSIIGMIIASVIYYAL